MHIATVNIAQTVKRRANITISNSYEVGLRLLYLDLTLVHSEDQCQAVHISTANISKMMNIEPPTLLLPSNMMSHRDFRLS